ncbi:MerR family transcriptional regulator [Heyndrickxia vini]|uniref:MerR family DNA-binding transcriptional regulator n=1 Tax=Heyndrickxia vini TaxID=1476025 RepID=A0ABX7E0P5_9BACI|nr:MerR family DNA-binding transcriptional regulator [Heyndrickxia vini]QQZ08801.1 MerR family DNA-binding transcriptional regulator [Heyndrickxia vini]
MHYSITEVAKHFEVTTRTIRYYEELGLIKPIRDSYGKRIYTKKEFTRLVLIFRGKRLKFSLNEIREMIQLFDTDRTGTKQLEKTIEYGEKKFKEVVSKIEELTELKKDIEEYLADFKKRLS